MPLLSGSDNPNPLPVKNGARGRAIPDVSGERRGPRHIPLAPFTGRRWRQPDEGQAAISCAEAAIYGTILTIQSKLLQNEASICREIGKPCIPRIAALRYFRYSRSNKLGIYIFVSSALLLPALLHRTDNTPPPSCRSGSRARCTSSRAGLFLFPPPPPIGQLPMRARPVLPLSRVHLTLFGPARLSSKHIGAPLYQLWNFWQRRLESIHHLPVSSGLK